jgi:hypothetical protein
LAKGNSAVAVAVSSIIVRLSCSLVKDFDFARLLGAVKKSLYAGNGRAEREINQLAHSCNFDSVSADFFAVLAHDHVDEPPAPVLAVAGQGGSVYVDARHYRAASVLVTVTE